MDLPIGTVPGQELGRQPDQQGWLAEIRATFLLAWPLVIAQIIQIGLMTTDIIMMGWLGPEFLAAGTLSGALIHPLFLCGTGILSATATMIAQAHGAGNDVSVRRSVRQGLWGALAISLVILPMLWQTSWILEQFGQAPQVSLLAEGYARAAVWLFFPALSFIVLRSFLAVHGDTSIILLITLGGIVVNFLGNYALMFGNWGFPRLELVGAGISTTIVHSFILLMMLGYVLSKPAYRRYELLVRFWKSDWPRFREIFHLGMPIGLLMLAEISLFAGAAILMGWLGTDALAGHAVALQCAAATFMVPLGISHAATIRVGIAHGRNSADGIRHAGWVAIGMGTAFMSMTALVFWLLPETIAGLFLDPAEVKNHIPLQLAVTFLGVAAFFQLADGVQILSISVLRGLSDMRVPMFVAMLGYWCVGFPVAYICAFILDMRGMGIWLGLASSLFFVAIVLLVRFAKRERFGLVAMQ